MILGAQDTMNWHSYVVGLVTGVPVYGVGKYLLDALLQNNQERKKEERAAAKALSNATVDLQYAVWAFASLHQPGVAWPARDLHEAEQKTIAQIDAALKLFRQDFDLPDSLGRVVLKETRRINLELLNLKAFSLTGQFDEMQQSAADIESACERIRDAAKVHLYGIWRRIRQKLGV